MRHYLLFTASLILFGVSCKQKEGKKEDSPGFVSVRSFIEEQVAHVDTSLFSIRKILIIDSARSDTSFIPREDFREAAKDFLSIPDLSDPDYSNRFNQESRYDSLLKRVVLTYTPIDPKKEEVKKQEILVTPEVDSKGNNKVSSIIIEKSTSDRNGFYGQKMLWAMDKYFMITTTTEKPGEPEIVTIMKVLWNED